MAPAATNNVDFTSHDSYLARENTELAREFENRSLDKTVPYLRAVLNSLPPTFSFLDVGLGPATITISIARDYPQATIVGLDYPDAISIAAENIKAAGVGNIVLIPGDALDIQAAGRRKLAYEAPGSTCSLSPEITALFERGFDVVHTHQVHEHVRDPVALMRELRAAARPVGGLVCCRELDMGLSFLWPSSPVLDRFREVFIKLMLANGNDPYVGRKLVSNALAAGFLPDNIDASATCNAHSRLEKRRAFAHTMSVGFLSESSVARFPEACKAAGLTVEVAREFAQAWEKWALECEGGFAALGSGQVVCRRHD